MVYKYDDISTEVKKNKIITSIFVALRSSFRVNRNADISIGKQEEQNKWKRDWTTK